MNWVNTTEETVSNDPKNSFANKIEKTQVWKWHQMQEKCLNSYFFAYKSLLHDVLFKVLHVCGVTIYSLRPSDPHMRQ